MTLDPLLAYARRQDRADGLAHYRARFHDASSDLVYFDGNSLGRPPVAAIERMQHFMREEWGGRLIRGWDESWLSLPVELGDKIGRAVIAAKAGQTVIGDSTTVLLYKLARAAVDAQVARDPARREIVVDSDNFPTDRYVLEGIARERELRLRWIEVDPATGVTSEQLAEAVGPDTALVVLSHVAYRSAYLADARELTRIAHDAGALVLWDLCHSAGSVPVRADEWGFDLAVGCTYKYLNGGPGSPAFAYVREDLQRALSQPIQGWFGAVDQFQMGPRYEQAPGIRGFLSGTSPIVAMLPMDETLTMIEEAGIAAIRAKSVALTSYAIELAEAWLAPLGVTLASPADPEERGGHVTLHHDAMREVTARLWQRDVIPDYRDPGGLRIGLSPLSTSFEEVHRGLDATREVLREVLAERAGLG
ncbi:kynureninase [Agromyces aerolatus]|uniref:kynureninase n=1 Tax=Agromyces sp. LY-1074 TaxID=3074080 RepID=UPI0028636497|nr:MULTISPECIES: aminotransferase class V-fold PLP-dependent enzyme [unclassified Agromyces]MDR5698743.1 aminotransferase class V-fold PLP-dependent enzyme [Agromyces sp. LY-1074]MDR5705037.1 aminotransferase class V-fold PLP-dependent enzyme [Agromyces sp. LY-1358]